MERRGAKLEGDTGDHEHHASQQQHGLRHAGSGLANGGQVQTAGGTVHQRHAVQQQARGQCAQHEVLHRRFRGQLAVTIHGHQCIRAQRQQLQAQIHHDQAARRDQQHHAEYRKQHQHRHFTLVQAAITQIGPYKQQRQCGNQARADLQHIGHGVAHKHIVEHAGVLAHTHTARNQAGHQQQRQHRQHMGQHALAVFQKQIQHQQCERGSHQCQFGNQWQQFGGSRHGESSLHRRHVLRVWSRRADPPVARWTVPSGRSRVWGTRPAPR